MNQEGLGRASADEVDNWGTATKASGNLGGTSSQDYLVRDLIY